MKGAQAAMHWSISAWQLGRAVRIQQQKPPHKSVNYWAWRRVGSSHSSIDGDNRVCIHTPPNNGSMRRGGFQLRGVMGASWWQSYHRHLATRPCDGHQPHPGIGGNYQLLHRWCWSSGILCSFVCLCRCLCVRINIELFMIKTLQHGVARLIKRSCFLRMK